jgi:nitrogen fixation-related uncharacterized protein
MSSSDERPRPRTLGPLHIFFLLAVTAAGCMFVFKLFSFLKTIKKDELAGFAYDPILIYGCVAAGFLLLLAWAYASGQFHDLERTKREMLDRFEEQERDERAAGRGREAA